MLMCDMGVTVSRRPPAVICRQQTAPLCECRNVSASPSLWLSSDARGLFNTDSSQHPPLEGGVCEVLQHAGLFGGQLFPQPRGRPRDLRGTLEGERLPKVLLTHLACLNMHAVRVQSFTVAACGCLVTATLPKVIPSGWVRGVDSMIRATWKPSLLVEKTKGTVAGQ